ncbi:ABC transporter permease [Puia dinghuensis]|uniref:ABC transporter permease n=1 Tax=Puia dinghuensis TaxID=1792502 RepID=A0A8J2UHA5_9BACT|nr:ABC transporter permease [Puia dinghuensis]GGB15917.1 ABC transporter permease [Puia dinghuensis]
MFKNHLKLAWRGLLKRKGYSALNIFGLTIGITCCLLIFNYVAYERSYDTFQPNSGRIVRLRMDSYQEGKLAWKSATVYPAIAPAMKKEFPEVEKFCRLIDANLLLTNPEKTVKFNELKGYYADPSALDMLDIHLTKGNPATALDGPGKILLSESMAKKYFGNEDPMGKRLTGQGGFGGGLETYEVTGVFKEYPANSHLILHHLVSYSTLGKITREQWHDSTNLTETSWGWYDYYDYVQLRRGADWKALQAKLPAFADRHMNNEQWHKKNNVRSELYLIPMPDIHLWSNYNQEAEVNGNGKAVGFLFLIAFLIIAIAWINYTNLATARSLERAKEVGLRKVLGAIRIDLISQFLIESFLLNTLALALAILLSILLAPSFATLIGSDAGPFSLPAPYALGFAGIFLLGSFLSGLYPAFILSGYHPITVLKGLFRNTTRGQVLRKGLIIGQFAVSVILITGTILVYQQVQYMRRQQLGFNIDQTLVLDGPGSSQQDSTYKTIFQPFTTGLLQQTGIKSITASSNVMGQEIYWTNSVNRVGASTKSAITLYILGIDYNFIPDYNLHLVAGRNFSPDYPTDKQAILINETALPLFGFKNAADALNGKLVWGDTGHIIGVVADYHHQGLQKAINPLLIRCIPDMRNYYSIKFTSTDVHQTITAIKKAWDRYFPNDPFNYFFLDESFNQQYKSDTRFGATFGIFATLAIIIACFGLLGLSAYNVLQRTKEIGIRKVLGATEQSLVFLLSKEFLYLVLISLVIAIPLAWWVMHSWLQDYAYRISIQWWVFALGGLLALAIALTTVGIQALRASLANPAKSLRTE